MSLPKCLVCSDVIQEAEEKHGWYDTATEGRYVGRVGQLPGRGARLTDGLTHSRCSPERIEEVREARACSSCGFTHKVKVMYIWDLTAGEITRRRASGGDKVCSACAAQAAAQKHYTQYIKLQTKAKLLREAQLLRTRKSQVS